MSLCSVQSSNSHESLAHVITATCPHRAGAGYVPLRSLCECYMYMGQQFDTNTED
ncbi:hypothetical protein PISMIDRAFT_679989 [Pisolithus microcarpus 441]|uniref:Uncharacterized protein n=1 Tax=Pisolithus microcarpus 441 TaxID=765257 RepID=A0A0C9Z9T6_9AGAM|nr:hypothetical protein PISMIDRAFT_679989 [Pisolithus microcarpus 441]